MLTQLYRYLYLLGRWLFKISRNLIKPDCHVEVLVGKEKFTKQSVTIVYIGSYRNYTFLVSKLFTSEYNQQQCIRKHPFFVLLGLKKLSNRADIIIIDLDIPYCFLFLHLKAFHIPPWVKQHLSLPSSSDELLAALPRKTRKEAQRWIRKFEYNQCITTEKEKFIQFYTDFYVPFIQERHGDTSEIVDLKYLLAEAKGGFLLWLNYKDIPIGAALLKGEAGVLRSVWVGFSKIGLEGELKGASDALDFYTIQYASEQGYVLVDFGPTRPLANDGVFRYKQKWGAEATLGKVPSGNIMMQPVNNNSAIQSFFSNNLWICSENKGISILCMVSDESVDLQKLSAYAKFVNNGISRLHFFSLDKIDKPDLKAVLSEDQYKFTTLANVQNR